MKARVWRELEVLQLIAQGRSNQEICERLVLALSTVKRHNRNIFGKLQVERRTEAKGPVPCEAYCSDVS
jgi:LuxR family maltose regulon positive regulatory protein